MSKALVTLAMGEHERLLEIALPSFQAFAELHDYDLIVGEPFEMKRSPAWQKLPLLRDCLGSGYTDVLWLDADIVIVDPTEDLPVSQECWQALVEHHTDDGRVPNTGVWLVREAMVPVMEEMWRMTRYLDHPWWEQAALVELMGYHGAPLQPNPGGTLHGKTCWLDAGWNVHRNDRNPVGRKRFLHATMHPDRERAMREWAGVPVSA